MYFKSMHVFDVLMIGGYVCLQQWMTWYRSLSISVTASTLHCWLKMGHAFWCTSLSGQRALVMPGQSTAHQCCLSQSHLLFWWSSLSPGLSSTTSSAFDTHTPRTDSRSVTQPLFTVIVTSDVMRGKGAIFRQNFCLPEIFLFFRIFSQKYNI